MDREQSNSVNPALRIFNVLHAYLLNYANNLKELSVNLWYFIHCIPWLVRARLQLRFPEIRVSFSLKYLHSDLPCSDNSDEAFLLGSRQLCHTIMRHWSLNCSTLKTKHFIKLDLGSRFVILQWTWLFRIRFYWIPVFPLMQFISKNLMTGGNISEITNVK